MMALYRKKFKTEIKNEIVKKRAPTQTGQSDLRQKNWVLATVVPVSKGWLGNCERGGSMKMNVVESFDNNI